MTPLPSLGPYLSIDRYGIIGDCRTAALVSTAGSVDWLCLPHFDSQAVFAALLDQERGGRFAIRPVGEARVRRRYLGDSAVLETEFHTATGTLRLRDAMTVTSEDEKRRRMWPEPELLRLVACTSGEVELEIEYEPRMDYGREPMTLKDRGVLGWVCERRGRMLVLRSEIALAPEGGRGRLCGRIRLREGQERALSLVYAQYEPAVIAPLGADARHRIEMSIDWWRTWSGRCHYREGEYRDAIARSLITLKLMTFAPSGAVVAAPTTSLPEQVGGERNWDYRYTWIRDASMTLRTLFDLGYSAEANAFLGWLLHTTRRTRPELQTLYTVFGSPDPKERELDLEGYACSRPVRIGNAASDQLQLDTYGELVAAVHEFVSRGGKLDAASRRMLVGFGNVVCHRWREPDEGIWEVRGGREQFTSSKVLCWAALDQLLDLHERGIVEVPEKHYRTERAALREAIERSGYDPDSGTYVSTFDGDEVDASLLLLPMYGYCEFDDPRILRTTDRVHDELCDRGFIKRYRRSDGLSGSEGAFIICTLWYISCRSRQGKFDDATEHFDNLLAHSNELGLFAEEIDPGNGMALGNFPQAYSHLGLIDAALTLHERRDRRPRGRTGAEGARM